MDTIHNIYVLDHPMFTDNNIKFLSYIKKNQAVIKDMGVKINIISLTPEQLEDPDIENFLKSKQIEIFPVLITDNKVYKGLHDIVNIYQTNIEEYYKHMREIEMQKQRQLEIQRQNEMQRQQQLQKQQMKQNEMQQKQNEMQQKQNAPIDSEEQIHSYMSSQLNVKNKNNDDDEDTAFGDGADNSMMDTYRHMMTRRNGEKKNPFSSVKMRTIENNERKTEADDKQIESMNMQDIILKQLQNKSSTMINQKDGTNRSQQTSRQKQMESLKNQMNDTPDDDEREDNIKGEVEEERVNIDPSNIEYDADDDPQDAILEKAYWSRVSETK